MQRFLTATLAVALPFASPAVAQDGGFMDTVNNWFGQALDGSEEFFDENFQEVPGLSAAEAAIYRNRLEDISYIAMKAGTPDFCRDKMLDAMADECLVAIDVYVSEIQAELEVLRRQTRAALEK